MTFYDGYALREFSKNTHTSLCLLDCLLRGFFVHVVVFSLVVYATSTVIINQSQSITLFIPLHSSER